MSLTISGHLLIRTEKSIIRANPSWKLGDKGLQFFCLLQSESLSHIPSILLIFNAFFRLERAIDVAGERSSSIVNPFAIERPHATESMLIRQGSCRGFSTLGENSPFKRQMSLRINDLPSNTARLSNAFHSINSRNQGSKVAAITELSPGDSVTALCQQLSQGEENPSHKLNTKVCLDVCMFVTLSRRNHWIDLDEICTHADLGLK